MLRRGAGPFGGPRPPLPARQRGEPRDAVGGPSERMLGSHSAVAAPALQGPGPQRQSGADAHRWRSRAWSRGCVGRAALAACEGADVGPVLPRRLTLCISGSSERASPGGCGAPARHVPGGLPGGDHTAARSRLLLGSPCEGVLGHDHLQVFPAAPDSTSRHSRGRCRGGHPR